MALTAPFANLENCVSVIMLLLDASCSREPALHHTKQTLQGTASAQGAPRNAFTCRFLYDKRLQVSCVALPLLTPKDRVDVEVLVQLKSQLFKYFFDQEQSCLLSSSQ